MIKNLMINKNNNRIVKFYEKTTDIYFEQQKGYIHGYYVEDNNEFLRFLSKFISNESKVLDAGCGMGKVSIDLANYTDEKTTFFGITLLENQKKIGDRIIKENNMEKRIILNVGDYHRLDEYFPSDYFDFIFFNESLFHSVSVKTVLEQAYKVLKKGGVVYAKDIYQNPSGFVNLDIKYKSVVRLIGKNYKYYPQKVSTISRVLKDIGFSIISFNSPSNKSDFNKTIEFEKAVRLNTYELIDKYPDATIWKEFVVSK